MPYLTILRVGYLVTWNGFVHKSSARIRFTLWSIIRDMEWGWENGKVYDYDAKHVIIFGGDLLSVSQFTFPNITLSCEIRNV